MRLGVVRLQRERAVEARQRLLEPLQLFERDAAIVQGNTTIGLSLQRDIYLTDRLRMIAALVKNDTEQVQAVKMIGLYFKNLIINLFRVCQSACLMQCQSSVKQ